jgi:hypothetical protein
MGRISSGAAIHLGELGGRATQFAGDVERVSGVSATTAQRATGGGRSDQNDVRQHQIAGGFGGIAARQRYGVPVRQSAQAGEEALDPHASGTGCEHFAGQSKGEECG